MCVSWRMTRKSGSKASLLSPIPCSVSDSDASAIEREIPCERCSRPRVINGNRLRAGLDRALEASVVGSFTRIGFAARSRLFQWEPLSTSRMDGKVSVVTGATSGLGLVTATRACSPRESSRHPGARRGARSRNRPRDYSGDGQQRPLRYPSGHRRSQLRTAGSTRSAGHRTRRCARTQRRSAESGPDG